MSSATARLAIQASAETCSVQPGCRVFDIHLMVRFPNLRRALSRSRYDRFTSKPAGRNGQMVIRRRLHDPALDAFDGPVASTRACSSEPISGAHQDVPGASDRGRRRLGKAELSEAGKCLGNGRAALLERRSERGGQHVAAIGFLDKREALGRNLGCVATIAISLSRLQTRGPRRRRRCLRSAPAICRLSS
jgi:hypothetical protein